jgi:hypothetical protein
MPNGVILLWFLFTVAAVVFVAIDIRYTPESPIHPESNAGLSDIRSLRELKKPRTASEMAALVDLYALKINQRFF